MLRTFVLALLVIAAGTASGENAMRFTAVDIYLDSTEAVAAWQFELSDSQGTLQVVGVERGDSAAYARVPYYDREAVRLGQADRIVVADYSLADISDLPSGRVRIATIHLMLDSETDEDIMLRLITATAHDGQRVDASVEFELQKGSNK